MRAHPTLLIATLVLYPQPAPAQDGPMYAGISAIYSVQRAGTSVGAGPSIPRPGVGGHAPGIVADVGGFVARAISVSGEVSVPARFTTVQETRYFFNFIDESRHRDLMLSALVHMHTRGARRVQLAGVVGPSLVREDSLRRQADQVEPGFLYTGNYGPWIPDGRRSAWRFGITAGVDADVRVTLRLSIVPAFRVHTVFRGTDTNSAILQLGRFVFRPAVGIRAVF